jgi:hypothetical protein
MNIVNFFKDVGNTSRFGEPRSADNLKGVAARLLQESLTKSSRDSYNSGIEHTYFVYEDPTNELLLQ